MALIICPECNGKVSDQAETCIHCGFPLKNKKQEENLNKNICIYKNEQYDLTELVKYLKGCTFPGYDNKELDYNILSKARSILENIMPNITGITGDELIYYIKVNRKIPAPEFIPTRNIEQYIHVPQQSSQPTPQSTNQLKCPRCGSTSITTEEEGYSLLTGFWGASRKHNLCQKCGYRWKPGKK